MRLLATSIGIRIFAVLVLLALRPCIVASVATDEGRTKDPAIQQIADDATAHLAHPRRIRYVGLVAVAAVYAAALTALIEPPKFFAAIIDFSRRVLDGTIAEILSPRGPPL